MAVQVSSLDDRTRIRYSILKEFIELVRPVRKPAAKFATLTSSEEQDLGPHSALATHPGSRIAFDRI